MDKKQLYWKTPKKRTKVHKMHTIAAKKHQKKEENKKNTPSLKLNPTNQWNNIKKKDIYLSPMNNFDQEYKLHKNRTFNLYSRSS